MKSKAPLSLRILSLVAIAIALSLAFVSLTPAAVADDPKAPSAEQIAETVIAFAGNGAVRAVLDQIRRNGVERGRLTRTGPSSRVRERRSKPLGSCW